MSAITFIPNDLSSAAGPSPDSCRSCGELNVPPATMTSALGVRNACRAAAPVFDADGAASGKEDPARQRVRHDGEIGPAARLAQIAERGRAATPMACGQLEITGAFLGGAVEIVVARKARLLRGRDESLAQGMRFAHI